MFLFGYVNILVMRVKLEEKAERKTAISKAYKSELAGAPRTKVGCECGGRIGLGWYIYWVNLASLSCSISYQQGLFVGSLAFIISRQVSS